MAFHPEYGQAGYQQHSVVPPPPPPPPPPRPTIPSGGAMSLGPSVPRYTQPSAPSYGGGGAAPAPVAGPAPTLGDSATYQAFLRSLGLEESQAQSSTQDRTDALRREFNRSWSDIGQAGQYTREGISGGMESRGLFHSGEHEQALARQLAAEGQQVGNLRGGVDDQINILGNDLARRIADINLRKSNATLGAAGDVYQLPQ